MPDAPETARDADTAATTPEATVRLDLRAPRGVVDANVYGHFLEGAFYGNIDGGLFDEGSELSVGVDGPLRGCRLDVLDACRDLGVPVLRWPGGNYTSGYHFADGIGPRDGRPRRLDLAWGDEESNRFGTPEFLAWCAYVGAEPYLAHSCRDVEEAARWVEYTNYDGDTTLARQRRRDGLAEPHRVTYWGLGNEVYGPWQIGHRGAAQYAADAVEHAKFMRAVDRDLRFIAVGDQDPDWTRQVVRGLGSLAHYTSLHLYGATPLDATDSSTEFDEIVSQPLYFEQQIAAYQEMVERAASSAGLESAPQIAMDEWNIRHVEPASWPEPRRGDDGGMAPRDLAAGDPGPGRRVNRYSPRSLADALFYAGVFHAVHRTAGAAVPVTMTNPVNMVNAHGLFEVRPKGLVRSATFHVWDLYQNRMERHVVPVEVTGPARTGHVRQGDQPVGDGTYRGRPGTIPLLDVSAATDAAGEVLTLAVINRDARRPIEAALVSEATTASVPRHAEIRVLSARDGGLFDHNTLTDQGAVSMSSAARVDLGDGRRATFLPASITHLRLDLRG